jgi:hypothetical protein
VTERPIALPLEKSKSIVVGATPFKRFLTNREIIALLDLDKEESAIGYNHD